MSTLTKKSIDERSRCLLQLTANCRKMDGIRSKTYFYANYSKKFNKDKHMHVCKDCLTEYIGDMATDKESAINRALDIFPFLDIAYKHQLFMDCDTLGAYFKILAGAHHGQCSWKHSEYEKVEENKQFAKGKEDISQLDEWNDFWGEGYSQAEYRYLDSEYERLRGAYEDNNDYAYEILFKQICTLQLQDRRDRKNGLYNDKIVKQIQDLLGSANLKPSQTSLNNQNVNVLGIMIAQIESTRPIEHYEEYKDINRIEESFEKDFPHLKRLITE